MTGLRQQVLEEAKTWLKTPFEHAQRCKGGGVDCGQFLIAVGATMGLMPEIKTDYYPRDFHRHNRREWYAEIIQTYCDEIKELPEPGDIVLFRLDDAIVYSHGAWVVKWPRIIHAYIRRGVQYGDATQGWMRTSDKKFFSPRKYKEEKEEVV